MDFRAVIPEVSSSTGYSKELIEKVYMAFWKAVKMYMESLPLKQDLTDEEFLQLRPSVNVPSLGKFHITLGKYHRIKEFNNKILETKKKNLKDLDSYDAH